MKIKDVTKKTEERVHVFDIKIFSRSFALTLYPHLIGVDFPRLFFRDRQANLLGKHQATVEVYQFAKGKYEYNIRDGVQYVFQHCYGINVTDNKLLPVIKFFIEASKEFPDYYGKEISILVQEDVLPLIERDHQFPDISPKDREIICNEIEKSHCGKQSEVPNAGFAGIGFIASFSIGIAFGILALLYL